jgi:hypothetical protein
MPNSHRGRLEPGDTRQFAGSKMASPEMLMFDRLPRLELTKRYGWNVYIGLWVGSDR